MGVSGLAGDPMYPPKQPPLPPLAMGLVGENLMFHAFGFVQGLFHERLDSHKGPQACCILK